MKSKKILSVAILVVFIVSTASMLTDTGRAGKTASPGEGVCADCHSNTALNAGPGSVSITSNIPGWVYTPGMTYHITVTVSEAGRSLFGLGVEALKNSGNSNAGTFMITNSTETQILNAPTTLRKNVTHKLNGGVVTTPGSKAFMFDWMAPSADSGAVTFYVASIAGIADADETDDNAYTTKRVVNSPTSIGVNELSASVNFTVFPNPVADVINISIHSTEHGRVSAALYSLLGQKATDLFNENLTDGGIDRQIPVPGTLAKGTYLLQVTLNGKSSIQRVIVQ